MKFFLGVLAALLIVIACQYVFGNSYFDGAIAGAWGAAVAIVIGTWK